jgi:hypothetical protein
VYSRVTRMSKSQTKVRFKTKAKVTPPPPLASLFCTQAPTKVNEHIWQLAGGKQAVPSDIRFRQSLPRYGDPGNHAAKWDVNNVKWRVIRWPQLEDSDLAQFEEGGGEEEEEEEWQREGAGLSTKHSSLVLQILWDH